MALRIRFIEPAPPGHHVYDHAMLPRLGTPLMGAVLADAGHDVRCYCEVIAPVDVADCLSADLVGISSTTSTQPAAYQLAEEFDAAGVPVVLGGPHVTFLADEGLDHAGFVVRGEGQRTIAELAEALERGRPLEQIPGLSWRDPSGQRHHNPDRLRCSQHEFEALPAPGLSLIAGNEQMAIKPVMTQWGCPFDCEFCSVTAMFSRRVRHRRNVHVLAEIAALDAKRVFFHDDNFVVDKRRTGELLRSMVDTGLTPDWFAQVRAETVYATRSAREPDHDFLALMKAAGCQMVMIGFESTSDRSLVQMNKKMQVRDIVESVRLFHDHGILVHGMFVAGADTDDAGQAGRTVDFARRHGIDTIQIMIETPLPGTRLFERARADGRILTTDWSLYDGHHAVMRPMLTHPRELQLTVFDAMSRFYSRRAIALPGIAAAFRNAPALARLASRGELARRFPALARLAALRRWHELRETLKSAMPRADWARLQQDFAVPALRAYGRGQVAKWWAQDRSQAHLAFLAALS
ncbi:MAG: B12-binding domain-containing radical SAM protein [Micromonosporaceae bacterium]